MIRRRVMMAPLVAWAVAMLPVAALAQDGTARDGTDGVAAAAAALAAPSGTTASDLAAPSAGAPFETGAVTEDTLRSAAGREDTTQVSHAEQVAGVSRNSVGDNSLTGDARIDGNAFQNMSGLSILNVNTGNNVAINAAMNVNISLGSTP